MLISVLVATADREPVLRRMLHGFSEVEPPAGGWELIVADNGSRDGTAALLARAVAEGVLPLRTVRVDTPGKPAALNRGLALARGDVVAFTDDDCVPDPGWLRGMVRAFEAEPELAGLGGRVEPLHPEDGAQAVRTGREARWLTSPRELYGIVLGCNMAFRRSVFDRLGPFDPDVGPGARIPSGNDIDLVYRLHRARLRFGYRPDVVLRHGHGRSTPGALDAARRRYVLGRGAFYCKWLLRGDRAVARMAALEVLDALGYGPDPAELSRLGLLLRGAAARLALPWRRAWRPR